MALGGRQGGTSLGHLRVIRREYIEQADQVRARLVPVLPGGALDDPEQPVERLLDPSRRHVDVGYPALRRGVVSVLGCFPAGASLVVGGDSADQVDLSQPYLGDQIVRRCR